MVTRLCAPNPSPMTLDGTNGFIVPVGPGALVAIDPGIDNPAHIENFVRIARDMHATYAAIFVTHGHPDHYPGALALRRETRAPIFAHPRATFEHDRSVGDNARLTFEDATLHVLHVPGHAPDHIALWYEQERSLFTGDVVIGTGTVVIAPPDGNMRHYQASLERLLLEYSHADAIYGGHGPTIRDPRAKLAEYIEHRKRREAQIVECLERAPATIPQLVTEIYAGVDASLWPAAARQVLAYLIAFEDEARIAVAPMPRAPTNDEAQLLNPDLAALSNRGDAAVLHAELGFNGRPEPFLQYTLRRSRV